MKSKKEVTVKKRTLKEWRKENPLKYRVQNFMSTLKKTGEAVPARENLLALAERYVGDWCPYCGTLLTVENISLDHSIPKARVETKSDMNNLSNLKIVCRECNAVKGEFTHNEFMSLLAVCLAFSKETTAIFRKRMKMATLVYGRRR